MTERVPPLQETAREWRIVVCPECGAQEHDPPSDCAHCESGGQLHSVTVVLKAAK